MPITRHLDARDPEQVAEAARLLRAGRLVAFATETVYGLGADAFSPSAVAGIFAAKGRPAWDPLIVHLGRIEDLLQVVLLPLRGQEQVDALTRAFWPGPLTLLLPRTPAVPDAVTAGRALVGVRVPAHPAARALLEAAGVPVAAPSANRFGHVSPTTAQHVLADLDGRIDAVLDAGPCPIGVESTVLDPLRTPMLLYRQGAVTAEALEAATGVPVEVYRPAFTPLAAPPRGATPRPEALPSPGVGLRHYAPRARLVLSEGQPEALRERALAESRSHRTGVLLPKSWPLADRAGQGETGSLAKLIAERIPAPIPELVPKLIVEPWAAWDDPAGRAATLFAALRALDAQGVEVIVCPLPPLGKLEDAIRDRLEKGARAV